MEPILETSRLYLTRLAPEMAGALHRNSLDEDMRRFVPDEVWETPIEARAAIEQLMRACETPDGPFVYAVLTKMGENIGYVQACRLKKDFEIGYHIAQPWNGQGYATEAVTAFLPFVAQKLGVELLWGIVLEENAASRRVLEKCGFVLSERKTDFYQGKPCALRVYQWKRGL